MIPTGILETVLYAKDLAAAEAFYRDVLGMEPFAKMAGRHLFYRCGDQVLLIFNPDATKVPPAPGALPVPPHGMEGEGHVCFRASAAEIDAWRATLAGQGHRHRGRLRVARRRPLDLFPRSRRQLPGVRRAAHLEARMTRRLDRGTRLVVASHNPGKVREILDLVAPHGLSVVSAAELGLPEPEETGATFAANAQLKAEAAAQRRGLPALSDDSGPGGGGAGRGARHLFGPLGRAGEGLLGRHAAGGGRGEAARGLERARPARQFHRCAVPGLAGRGDGAVRGQGLRPSRLAAPRRPRVSAMIRCSLPDGHTLTFGEMEPDAKHAISHRARAFQLLRQRLPRRRRGRLSDDAGFGVYVHWPFCASKCPYCDFNSHVRAGGIDEARFLRAYLHRAAALGGAGARPPGHQHLLRRRHAVADVGRRRSARSSMRSPSAWSVRADAEITLEANPSSVEAARFRGYRAAGVNRVSLGVQSLDDADLRALGRLHTAKEALAAIDVARATFERCSFDMIYARPGQTLQAWRAELSAGAGAGGPASVALPADDRAGDALRGAARARQAARARRRDGPRSLRADPGADRASGAAGLRDLQPRRARRGVPPQPAPTGATASTPASAPARTAAS